MKLLLFLITFCTFSIGFAQFEDERVTLIEDKQPKRTILYVKNNTVTSLNVFLKVDGVGYRRSSDRPIIKDIPANEQVEMITLIPLRNEPSSYTHLLVVNDSEKNLTVEFEDDPELQDFMTLLNNDLVVFTKDECPRCDQMISLMQEEHTPFKVINIDDRKRYYDALYVLLKLENEEDYSVKLPIVRKRGEMIYPIWNVRQMAKLLSEEFK
jgi:glutaredoxin